MRELQFREVADSMRSGPWLAPVVEHEDLTNLLRAILLSGDRTAAVTSVMFRMADGGFLEWRLKPYPEKVDEAIDQDWRVVRLAPATQAGSWVITEEITK